MEGFGNVKARLVLMMKACKKRWPNSATCRAIDIFRKMYRCLWLSAYSIPPTAAQRLFFAMGGKVSRRKRVFFLVVYPSLGKN